MLKLYDTLSKSLTEIPKKDHINLYTCGPTVYNYAHIGNLRSYILADLLYRTLKYGGYNPKWVMNITDIDDKTIKGTLAKYGPAATVENLREYTKFYLDEFLKDLGEVNVISSDDYQIYEPGQSLDFKKKLNFIRVTDVIKETQEFIVQLIDKGYAYKAEDGSTYFSIEKYQKDFGDYGELVGHKFLEGKKVGARVAVDEYEKENLSDFALWKAWDEKTDGQIFWDHPLLGKGRPGWHIECSVINKIGFNGEPTDIHTGGVDLIFPHHSNEIAQSQALVGKGNFVHHWFHSEHLLVDGKKMSKSAGNFYTLKDLGKENFTGLDFRYAMLGSSYRGQQNFTWQNLLASHQAVSKAAFDSIPWPDEARQLLENDLNVSEVLGRMWKENYGGAEFEQVFGMVAKKAGPETIPAEVAALLNKREQSREEKDFKKSDEIRKQIENLGYEVMDTPDGQKVRKKLKI